MQILILFDWQMFDRISMCFFLLAYFGDSLESLGACTRGGLGLVSMQASLPLVSTDLKSSVVEEEQLYDCFSPYGSPCPSP
jgi:hypothetical protein